MPIASARLSTTRPDLIKALTEKWADVEHAPDEVETYTWEVLPARGPGGDLW